MTQLLDRPNAPVTDRLRRDVVSLPGVVAHAISVIAPTLSGAFITYLAAQKAGGATPLSFALATVVCLFIGLVVCDFAQRLPSAGSLYTYAVDGLGPAAGFVVGCCYTIGYAIGCSAILAGSGAFIAAAATDRGAPDLVCQWWFWAGLGLMLYLALSWFRVEFSTRSQLALTAATSSTLALLALIVIGKGGATGNTITAFDPGTAGVSLPLVLGGMAFAMLSFVGFEAAAALAEETRDPRRTVPRAVVSTVLVAGAFFVMVTYATSIGYGVHAATQEWPASGGGLGALAARYASWLTDWVLLAAGLCSLFAGLGAHNTVSRTLYAMGREGVLPRRLGRTHPRHGTPHIAIGTNLMLTLAIAAVLIGGTDQTTRDRVSAAPGPLSAGFYLLAEGLTFVAPFVLLAYAAVSVAGLRAGRRDPRPGRGRRTGIALAALAGSLTGLVGSLYYCFVEVAPGSGVPGPYRAVPVVLVLALVIACTAAAALSRRGALVGLGTVFE